MSQIAASTYGPNAAHRPSHNKNGESVRAFLSRYASRQTFLNVIQGLCAFVFVLMPLVFLITLADGMRWLNDTGRWTVTCLTYVCSFVAAWRCGLQAFWQRRASVEIAQSVEDSSPRFRESLLSSIELRGDDGSAASGSDQFVSAIERSVAHELRNVEIDELLPWNMIARSLILCILALLATLFLCAVPNLRYPERLARAMLPFVSLARPSNVRISILEPSPASLTVPSEQTLRFLAEVNGVATDNAILEFSESDELSSLAARELPMVLESENPRRFSIVAAVGSKTTHYRIKSGDGESAWHRIETMSRPKPVEFQVDITPPKYVDPKVASEFYSLSNASARGDLVALKGSRIQLKIAMNQKLAQGSIEMEVLSSGRREVIPLKEGTPSGDMKKTEGAIATYLAEFDLTESARYQLRLQSTFQFQGNPLENSFSPVYKLEALDDPASVITWISSENTLWKQTPNPTEIFVVASNELIEFSASTIDNLPIKTMSFETSVNRGEWRVVLHSNPIAPSDLAEGETRSVTAPAIAVFKGVSTWNFDLANQKLENGDSIDCRAKVTDLNGSVTYSPTVSLSVSSLGFERNRHDTLERLADLVPAMKELSDHLASQREASKGAIELLRNPGSTVEQRTQSAKDLRATAQAAILKAQAIRSKAEPIVKELSRCIDQSDVELAVRSISSIEKDYLQYIDQACGLDFLTAGPTEVAGKSDWYRNEREARLNRVQQTLDQSHDISKRTLELYRNFVAFELQSMITMDLTGLMRHQQTLLKRKPNANMEAMIRSQKLTDQYCKSVTTLIHKHNSSVNQDIRDGMNGILGWLEQTRLELNDLCGVDLGDNATDQVKAQARDQLRNRIERSVNDLRHQRSGFNSGGGFIWNIQQTRREMFGHSGSLRNAFNESLDRVRRRNELARDPNANSNEFLSRIQALQADVTGPYFTSLGQMLDRRDLHQRRNTTDPMFSGDMGLAHRAWSSVLENWLDNPSEAEAHTKNLEEISKAFAVLEAAHESVEARLVTQVLRTSEQYEWSSLEAQFNHPTQWDSIAYRLELAQQWMRESGVPNPIAEKFNALRYGEIANRIGQKLNPRRDINNQNAMSAGEDLQQLILQWNEADAELKPILDSARATLAKFAPSISELANKAAEATEQLKKQTEAIQKTSQAKNPDKSAAEQELKPEEAITPTDSKTAVNELLSQKAQVERKLQKLQEAIIEQAGRQDLLKNDELQVAKESDIALQLLDAVSIPMNQAIESAAATLREEESKKVASPSRDQEKENPTAQSVETSQGKLKEAVQRESDTVDALRAVADHFETQDADQQDAEQATKENQTNTKEAIRSPDLEESSDLLRKLADAAARKLALDPESPELLSTKADYERARDLANAANGDPKSLLENLERELKSNSTMQAELSDIAKAKAESIANTLRAAANDEKQYALQVETSDARLFAEKQLQKERAQALKEQVDRFTSRSLNKAAQTARATGKNEQANALDQVAQGLREKANALQQIGESSPREQFQDSAAELGQALDNAKQQLAKASTVVEPLIEQAIHKEEPQRQNAKNSSAQIQNQIRDEMIQQGKESVQRANQRVQEANQQSLQLSQPLKDARKQTEVAKQRFEKESTNKGLLEQLQQAVVREEQLNQKAQVATERAKQAEQWLAQATANQQSMEQAVRAELDKPNPQAALAAEQIDKSKEQIESLQSQLESVAQTSRALPEPRSPSTNLANIENAQKKLEDNVRSLASELDAAARHEARLGNKQGEKSLKDAARGIEQTSNGSMKQATQDLGQTAKAVDEAEENQAKSSPANEAVDKPLDRPSSQGALNSLMQASIDLQGKAKQLDKAVGESSSAKRTDSQSGQSQQAKSGSKESDGTEKPPANAESSSSPNGNSASQAATRKSTGNTTKEDISSDREKARLLDQLDSQLNSKNRDASREYQDSVRQSASKLSSEMNQQRLDQQAKSNSQSKSSKQGKAGRSTKSGAEDDRSNPQSTSSLPNRAFETNREWGKLREQRADDILEGRRDDYDPEFSEAIQAYYRALGKP